MCATQFEIGQFVAVIDPHDARYGNGPAEVIDVSPTLQSPELHAVSTSITVEFFNDGAQRSYLEWQIEPVTLAPASHAE